MALVIKDSNGKVADKDILVDAGKVVSKKQVNKPIPTQLTLEVPNSLLVLLNKLSRLPNVNGNEYAVLYKVEEVDKMTYRIEEGQYLVPHQEVTPGNVTINSHLELQAQINLYNGVVHRHPAGVRSFSTTDDLNLNKSYFCSLLYLLEFDTPTAVINLPLSDEHTLQVKCIVKTYGEIDLSTEKATIQNGVLKLSIDEDFINNFNHKITPQRTVYKQPNSKVSKQQKLDPLHGAKIDYEHIENAHLFGFDEDFFK